MSSALDALVRQYPAMAPASSMLQTLATALPDASLPEGVPHLGAAQARLESGVPALEGEPLLSGPVLLSNVRALAIALGPVSPAGLVAETLEHGIHNGEAEELAAAAQSGVWSVLEVSAVRMGLDSDAVITLADHAARPALRAGAHAVRELVALSAWNGGTCPACGASPLLAELRSGGGSGGAERERVLRCGRCLSAWNFPRLRCVACEEANHLKLAYLHAKGEEDYRRADICSTCHTYLKSVAVLAPLSLAELLAIDLATSSLDLAAVECGFRRS